MYFKGSKQLSVLKARLGKYLQFSLFDTLFSFQTKQANLNTFSKMQDSFSSRVITMKMYRLLRQRYVVFS